MCISIFLSLRKIRQSLNPKFIVLVKQFYEALTDSRRTISSFSGLSTLSVFILTNSVQLSDSEQPGYSIKSVWDTSTVQGIVLKPKLSGPALNVMIFNQF